MSVAHRAGVKRLVKQAVQYISDFERRLLEHARNLGCDGVICGHIHTPAYAPRNDLTYINTGDWVENCTAFVEYEDGEFELLHYFDEHRRSDSSDEIDAFAGSDFAGATTPNLALRRILDRESEHAVGF